MAKTVQPPTIAVSINQLTDTVDDAVPVKIVDGVTLDVDQSTLEGYVDGLETLATALNGYVDGLEGLMTSLNDYVDGVETLITSTNTKLDTLAGYVDGLEGFVDGIETLLGHLTDGTARVKTSAPSSSHIGTNVNPNGSAVQFGSQATSIGLAVFTALIANGAPVYLGRGSGVTTSTGIELNPGDSITLPCENINEYWAIAAASQNVRALAL